jgi:hypothetical protein
LNRRKRRSPEEQETPETKAKALRSQLDSEEAPVMSQSQEEGTKASKIMSKEKT